LPFALVPLFPLVFDAMNATDAIDTMTLNFRTPGEKHKEVSHGNKLQLHHL